LARKFNGSIVNHAEKIKFLAVLFASSRVDVVIVCDGERRHHSNRASTMHQAKRHRNKVYNYLNKTKLMKLAQQQLRYEDDMDP
jgi:DNA-binding IscR family transcriptional regulator